MLEKGSYDSDRKVLITDAGTAVDADKGKISIKGLSWGEYRLTESRPKNGYANTAAVRFFTIGPDNADHTIQLSHDLGRIKNYKTELLIKKVDADSKEGVAGAVFTIQEDKAESTFSYVSAASNAEGQIAVKGVLSEGITYRLEETETPVVYKNLKDTVRLRIRNGNFEKIGIWPNSVQLKDNIVTIDNEKLTLDVKKRNAANTGYVKGAALSIFKTDENGNAAAEAVKDFISGDQAEEVTGILERKQKYVLRETKEPAGYLKADDINFFINEDNKLVVNGAVQADMQLIMKDKESKIYVAAVEKSDNKVFVPKAGLQIDGGGLEDPLTWSTGKEFYEVARKLSAGETYTISQTYKPAGYVSANDVTFKVNADGTVTLTNEEGILSEENKILIPYDKAKTSVRVGREDDRKTRLSDALLVLKTEDGEIIRNWKSDKKELELFDTLLTVGESYIAEEETPPSNYVKAKPVTFTITKEGKVKIGETVLEENIIILTSSRSGGDFNIPVAPDPIEPTDPPKPTETPKSSASPKPSPKPEKKSSKKKDDKKKVDDKKIGESVVSESTTEKIEVPMTKKIEKVEYILYDKSKKKVMKLVTNKEGKLDFTNVKKGAYTMVLAAVPKGYSTEPSAYKVSVTETWGKKRVEVKKTAGDSYQAAREIVQDESDSTGKILLKTGTLPVWIFYITGIAIALCGLWYLLKKEKK